MTNDIASERTRWTVHGERLVDENPHIRLSIASVELPTGVNFEQYVMRMRRCAMTVVLDDDASSVLLMWRHRFIIDRWVWELPGGYIDADEDGAVAAAREVEEETGWRPHEVEHVLTFQPMIGNADYPQDVYLARGARQVGVPEADEAEAVRWVPLSEASDMIKRGEIVGGATIIGIQHALLLAAAGGPRTA
ncbi:NUDIX hydrolase [Microtetraspora malaysiensis]|uniref:NUDIX hydrolase n=1 Tax=Microtetraspora malaysiensis TaxID=161358 RepID=UPI003D917621